MAKTINQQQVKRLYTIASRFGWQHSDVKRCVAKFKGIKEEYASALVIEVSEYDDYCNFFSNDWKVAQEIGEDLLWMFKGRTGDVPKESELEPYKIDSVNNFESDEVVSEEYESEENEYSDSIDIEQNSDFARNIETILDGLNNDQQNAIASLLEWIETSDDDHPFILNGSAGTGKSFTISRFLALPEISERFTRILLIAPTHAAKKVLIGFAESNDIRADVMTIHSSLGLGLDFDETGKQKAKKAGDRDEPIRDYNLVICDESYMADKEVMNKLLNLCSICNIKLVLLGDSLQLPPVGEKESILESKSFPYVVLNQVMRNSGLSTELQEICKQKARDCMPFSLERDWLRNRDLIEDEGLRILTEFEFRSAFLTEFESDPDNVRYLAFSNASVRAINEKVRKWILDYNDPYVIGEQLICNRPITTNFGKTTLANNGDLLRIEEIGTSRIMIQGVSIETIKLSCFNEDLGKFLEVDVLDQNSREYFQYSKFLDEVQKHAIQEKKKQAWARYYAVLNSIANVSHVHAMTIHKSQGKSIKKVFVESITCNDPIMQPRLWYVAASRHKEQLTLMR